MIHGTIASGANCATCSGIISNTATTLLMLPVGLLLMVMVLAGTINGVLGGFVGLIGLAVIPAHMFAQLKGTYGLSIFSALWRTIALLFFCVLASTLFLVAIIMMGLTG